MRTSAPTIGSFLLAPNIPHKAESLADAAPSCFKLVKVRSECGAPFVQEIVFVADVPELGERRCCGARNTFCPRQIRGHLRVSVDLNPVALASSTVWNTKLQLPTYVDEVRSFGGLYDLWNVLYRPRILVTTERRSGDDVRRE
jgi:hypothetical protein